MRRIINSTGWKLPRSQVIREVGHLLTHVCPHYLFSSVGISLALVVTEHHFIVSMKWRATIYCPWCPCTFRYCNSEKLYFYSYSSCYKYKCNLSIGLFGNIHWPFNRTFSRSRKCLLQEKIQKQLRHGLCRINWFRQDQLENEKVKVTHAGE